MKIRILSPFLLFFGILAACLFSLECDPSIFKWTGDPGDLSDEGMWTHNARYKALFGSYLVSPDECSYAFYGGPLFSLFIRIFFGLGGVNLTSARMVTVLSLWLTLLGLFFLFRKSGLTKVQSSLPVIILGMNHQALMEARWATPTFVEILFLSVTYICLSLTVTPSFEGRRGNFLFACAGLAFSAAIASKLSAVFMIPTFSAMILFLVYRRPDQRLSQIGLFALGSSVGAVILSVFYFHERTHFTFFLQAMQNTQRSPDLSFDIYSALIQLLSNSAIANPMIAVPAVGVCSLIGLRLGQFINLMRKGVKSREWNPSEKVEALTFIWLIIGLATFIFHPDRAFNRRFILFTVPICILFSRMVIVFFEKRKEKLSQFEYATVAITLISSLIFYAPKAQQYLNQIWLDKIGSNELSLFSWHLIYAGILPLWGVAIIMTRSLKGTAVLLGVAAMIINLGMTAYWYLNPTFTYRDEARKLARISSEDELGTGYFPWIFFFESRVRPVWFMKKEHYTDFNKSFPKTVWKYTDHLLIVQGLRRGKPSRDFDDYLLTPEDFTGMKTRWLGDYKLAPFPGTSVYRIEGRLTRVSLR